MFEYTEFPAAFAAGSGVITATGGALGTPITMMPAVLEYGDNLASAGRLPSTAKLVQPVPVHRSTLNGVSFVELSCQASTIDPAERFAVSVEGGAGGDVLPSVLGFDTRMSPSMGPSRHGCG